MNKNRINKLIDEIEERITLLKKEIGTSPKTIRSAKKVRTNPKRKARGEGSTQPIKKLIDNTFFDHSKSDVGVVSALRKKALIFDRSDVAVTLMRMVRSGALKREGDGTKKKPWRYKKT